MMKMNVLTNEILIEAIRCAGLRPRHYNGRFFANDCLGVEVPREVGIHRAYAMIIKELLNNSELFEFDDEAIAIKAVNEFLDHDANTDNLGLDSILYFPTIKVQHEDFEGEDAIDEEDFEDL